MPGPTMAPDGMPTHNTSDQLENRRRPGRMSEVSPALLPLIREDTLLSELALHPLPEERLEQDELGAIRGIMFSVALALPLWGLIILGINGLRD